MQIGCVPHRGGVSGPVPCGTNTEGVREYGDVARRRDPTHLADMHTNEVDELVHDQTSPLMRIVEQLAHRKGSSALLAHRSEPSDVLWRKHVLEEEESILLDVFRELHGVDWIEPLVYVVQQLDLGAELGPDVFDHCEHRARVGARVEIASLRCVRRPVQVVSLPAVAAHLDTNVAVAFVDETTSAVFDLVRIPTACVHIDRCRFT